MAPLYDSEQEEVILRLRATNPNAQLLDLEDFTPSEQASFETFNKRLRLYEALFTDVQYQLNNVRVNLDAVAIVTGVSRDALANDVQVSLNRADTAYQKPAAGIPYNDLDPALKAKVDAVGTYTPPPGGIPFADLAADVPAGVFASHKWYRHRFVQNAGSIGTDITLPNGDTFTPGSDALFVMIDGQIQDKEITYTEKPDGTGIILTDGLAESQILVLRWYGPV